MRTCPRYAYGRKIHGRGTRGVVRASDLGRVRNNRADAAKESHDESVNIQPDSPASPLSIVETFLTSEHVDISLFINSYTNMMNDPHIQAQLNAKNRSVFNRRRNSNRDEMWLFLLLMIIIQKPSIHSYWNPRQILPNTFVKLSNEKDQKQTVAMTRFTDPNNEICDDSRRKLCYFLETLISNWKHNYTFKEYLAKDEYFSLWKGGLNFTIYIPTKRERCGVKIFMFFEGETGCLLNFIAYTGETTYPCDLTT